MRANINGLTNWFLLNKSISIKYSVRPNVSKNDDDISMESRSRDLKDDCNMTQQPSSYYYKPKFVELNFKL